MNKEIYCYADWQGLGGPTLIGVLHAEVLRGKEVFRFESDPDWLRSPHFRLLDPDLGQFSGSQYLRDDKPNFGLFLDSSPDRWGRTLIQRREAIRARAEGRKAERLHESDYLLGVYDGTRMGSLRFKLSPDGPFLDNDSALATPPWSSIRDLEYACNRLEEEGAPASDERRWVDMLLHPGSSLGGARPKANVADGQGNIWIVKFPSRNDNIDMGAWECVANDLAAKCGITVPEHRAQAFLGRRHSFLTKRFDRAADSSRLHMASAMTLLGYSDGDDASTGVSYLQLAEFIIRYGSRPEDDLRELWRRIAFNVAISNTDDHLRNHAFMLDRSGWRLSPVYDINPNEYGGGLKLNIDEHDNSLDLELVRSVAPYFRLKQAEAENILREVLSVVSTWRSTASRLGISQSEQDRMATAFTK